VQEILVIRFGSLGDLCLLGWSLSALADGPGADNRRVTLVTKQAFAPLLSEVRGVDRVVPLTGAGIAAVAKLAAELRKQSWDSILDAHNILRGHLLLGLMLRSADRRLAKDTTERLFLLRWGRRSDRLERTMRDRFDELTLPLQAGDEGLTASSPPLAALATGTTRTRLGLAPGAQWSTKRWPEDRFAELLHLYRRDHSDPVRVFLGPRETEWFDRGPLAAACRELADVEVLRGQPLVEVARSLAECRVLVTNDSGLLHVAEAVGTPVRAFFGPTVREFGYFPLLGDSRVLERSLDCRPCSRNGKRPCHRQDLACLAEISASEALASLPEAETRNET